MGKVINGIQCEECLAPELVRFEAGDTLEGVLLNRDRVSVQGKPVIQYLLEKTNGMTVKFFGTADIVQKLRPDHVGRFLSITCRGEDQMVKRGENCMKVFEIFASEKPVGKVRVDSSGHTTMEAPRGDGTEITDEDIPF